MSFVQTGFLVALASLAIPLVIHLLSRLQVRTLELGTMRFFSEVIREGSNARKIRRWFLLLMRLLLIALLALLFARPFLSERARKDGNRMRIVMIDRSTSMGMQGESGRLIDDAVREAITSTSDLGSDATILWAWFDHRVEPMGEQTQRPVAPQSLTGDTNYLAALSWARDRAAAFSEALVDVVIVTDLQQSGAAGDPSLAASLEFPKNVPVRVVAVNRAAANNVAVTNLVGPATRVAERQKVEFRATLFNFGTLPIEETPLIGTATSGNRSKRIKKSINVPAGQAEEVLVDFGQLDAGTWQIQTQLDASDDLRSDNVRFAAIDVAKPIEVLVLDSGKQEDGASAESYFLSKALSQSSRTTSEESAVEAPVASEDEPAVATGRFQTEVLFLADEAMRVLDPSTTPLVVVADSGAASLSMLAAIERYVQAGGNLLVFAGDGMTGNGSASDTAAMWQQVGLSPGKFRAPTRSGTMPFRIVTLAGRGSMLSPFEDPQHGDISRLAFKALMPVTVAANVKVLASFEDSLPALTEHTVGKGRVVWFLSSADSSWGNWTTSPLYLPLVQQMAAGLLGLTGEGPIRFRTIGSNDDRVDEGVIDSPPGFAERGEALYVYNGSAKESDTVLMDPESFAQQFGLSLASGENAVEAESVDSEQNKEYWPWLASAVFVLLVFEFALANRTSA